jgi:gluconate 2-dehydrogenase gamma chain
MTGRTMSRRQTLKYIGMLTGSVAGREFLAAWLPSFAAAKGSNADLRKEDLRGIHACAADQPPDADAYTPIFFKSEEFNTVEKLTELIIPSDESAGAKEARVARYIDFIVSAAGEFDSALQHQWIEGLQVLGRLSGEKYKVSFNELSTKEQETLLEEMSVPERNRDVTHPGYEFYRLVKEMTVEGFYTSRVGLIDVLEYKGLDALSEFPGCTHREHQP